MVAVDQGGSPMSERLGQRKEKALKINPDAARYGTFAEIGAGQRSHAGSFR